MNKSIVVPIVIAVVVTAVVVGGLAFLLRPTPEALDPSEDEMRSRVVELEEDVQALQGENQELREQVLALEEELESLEEEIGEGEDLVEGEVRRKPKPGWQEYFPEAETTTLLGESIVEVRQLLGEPAFKIRSIAVNPAANREIWIFTPFEEDPTGLYLFFKGNQLWRSRMDEFMGLYGSELLQDEDFWLN